MWANEDHCRKTWLLVTTLLTAMCSQATLRDSEQSGGEEAESLAASPTFALLFLLINRTLILPGMVLSLKMTSLKKTTFLRLP